MYGTHCEKRTANNAPVVRHKHRVNSDYDSKMTERSNPWPTSTFLARIRTTLPQTSIVIPIQKKKTTRHLRQHTLSAEFRISATSKRHHFANNSLCEASKVPSNLRERRKIRQAKLAYTKGKRTEFNEDSRWCMLECVCVRGAMITI